jgi:hypothetical protein
MKPPRIPEDLVARARARAREAAATMRENGADPGPQADAAANAALSAAWGKLRGDMADRASHLISAAQALLEADAREPDDRSDNYQAKRRGLERALADVEGADDA